MTSTARATEPKRVHRRHDDVVLETIELRLGSDPVHGRVVRDPDPSGDVTVVVVAGSGGGDRVSGSLATALAREGFTALRLGYFKVPGRSDELRDIDLEYLVESVHVARSFAPARDAAVVLLGASRGSEAVQFVAAEVPATHALSFIAPSRTQRRPTPRLALMPGRGCSTSCARSDARAHRQRDPLPTGV